MRRCDAGLARPPARGPSLVAAAWLLALGACTAPPAAPPPPVVGTPAPTAAERARDDHERRLRAAAGTAMAERRWNEAALSWELLATLHPADPLVAAQLADCRQRNQAAVADLQVRADQALRRGDADTAARRWWAMLALDPTNATAAAGLRKLESDRQRRLYLGRRAAAR